MSYRRTFAVDRASVNEETGEFRAVLFSDGEASDGHVLNIQGGRIPNQMPLFVNHQADPREQLGSLYLDRVTPHQVHVRGQIMLEGEGPEAEVRRDIMAKIAAGHVSRMSGRWDAEPEHTKPRTQLPADHPHRVSDKARGRKRYGLYFDKWTAQEGSIVGLGADPQATMRWAEEADSEPVAAFWREQAERADGEPAEDTEVEVEREETTEVEVEREETADADDVTDEVVLGSFRDAVRSMIEAGLSPDDLVATIEDARPKADAEKEALRAEVEELRLRLEAAEIYGREHAPPPTSGLESPARAFSMIQRELRRSREEFAQRLQQELEKRRGRLPQAPTPEPNHRDELAAALQENQR